MGRIYKEYFPIPIPFYESDEVEDSCSNDEEDEEDLEDSNDEDNQEDGNPNTNMMINNTTTTITNSSMASLVIYVCSHCKTHLCCEDSVVSRAFVGSHGSAYLFNQVMNVTFGEAYNSTMRTGLHRIQRAFCVDCRTDLGWKYLVAYESDQKYKEGMIVLEKNLIQNMTLSSSPHIPL